jgi:mono/diheme cytochrome c family protein
MRPVRPVMSAALVVIVAVAAACGSDDGEPAAWRGTAMHFVQDSYPARYVIGDVHLPGSVLARGDSLYQGAIGGANCIVCHGPFLNAGSPGLNLRNAAWYHGDGSLEHIIRATTYGVEASLASAVPYMPPMGGVPLTPEEVQAIAAYIHWYAATNASPGEAPDADPAAG